MTDGDVRSELQYLRREVERLAKELEIQFKRIAELQAQMDVLLSGRTSGKSKRTKPTARDA